MWILYADLKTLPIEPAAVNIFETEYPFIQTLHDTNTQNPMTSTRTTAARMFQLVYGAIALLLALPVFADRNVSGENARTVPTWLRDGVVYELYPRNFSPAGNFNGITERLDELKDLGVNILWLMPIHPIGE